MGKEISYIIFLPILAIIWLPISSVIVNEHANYTSYPKMTCDFEEKMLPIAKQVGLASVMLRQSHLMIRQKLMSL